MGGCHGRMLPTKAGLVSRDSDDSQSTIVEDDHHDHKGVDNSGPDEDDLLLPAASFGRPLREKHFTLDPTYHNMNHSSYGTIPKYVQSKLQHYHTLVERRPDHFIRYTYPDLLDTNRAAVATLLNAPLECTVFVPNATTGVNTVLRGFPSSFWSADGKDEILHFGTIYGACGKTVAYIRDATQGQVHGRSIELTYPVSDAAIVAKFRDAVRQARHVEGKRPRVAIFDTVSSVPGVRFPFEPLVATCRELGILSLVDGAQGVGMLPLDLTALDPDFFTSNCHKWLLVPRACAVFYVPERNRHLVRSTLPTSHTYVPDPAFSTEDIDPLSRLPSSGGGDTDDGAQKAQSSSSRSADSYTFAEIFSYVGTLDNSAYLCVKDAIEWREKVLGGEDRIREYCCNLARDGGAKVAEILGTKVMQNEEQTLIDCFMVNVAMPLVISQPSSRSHNDDGVVLAAEVDDNETLIPYEDAQRVWEWMTEVLVEEYQTFIPVYYHAGRFWVRLSAQVYLGMEDFEWTGNTLKELSKRVARKEYNERAGIS